VELRLKVVLVESVANVVRAVQVLVSIPLIRSAHLIKISHAVKGILPTGLEKVAAITLQS
jgi:hypothetical protein